MGISEICSERGVTVRAVPAGTTLPEAAVPTGEQIQVMAEMTWALTSLQQSMEISTQIRGIMGTPGQEGSFRSHTWTIWGEVSAALSQETGVTGSALPFERIVEGVITRLDGERSAVNAGDLVRLRQIQTIYNQFITTFKQTLTGGAYPRSASPAYAQDRSFKHNIRIILERLDGSLPENLRTSINLAQINWTADQLSTADIAQVIGRANAQIESNCTAYAAAIPQPPATPQTPVTPQPPVTPPETPPAQQPRFFDFSLRLVPAASLAFQSEGETQYVPHLSGEAIGSFRLSEELSILAAYRGMIEMQSFSEFGVSRSSRDSGLAALRWNDLFVQGTYLYEYDAASDQGEHLGALGAGYRLFNGLLYPFLGLIAGSRQDDYVLGGYAGVGTNYLYNGEGLARFGVTGRAFYDVTYPAATEEAAHQVAGTATAYWRPLNYFGADLQLGLGLGGGYDTAAERGNFNVGLLLGWGNPELNYLQPVRSGGF